MDVKLRPFLVPRKGLGRPSRTLIPAPNCRSPHPNMGASSSGYSYIAVTQWMLEGSKRFGRAGYERASPNFTPLTQDLSHYSFIVTGANSGLGKATAQHLASRNATVHLLCRSRERGEAARRDLCKISPSGESKLHLHIVDFSSVSQVRAWAESWERTSPSLHGLVCNAGFIPESHSLTSEGLEPSWATALTQSYLLVGLLLPSLLRASSAGTPERSPPARIVLDR